MTHKSDIQAVLFDNKYYTEKTALDWLKKHHHMNPIKEVHKTARFLRYRIYNPKEFDHFITLKLSKHIELIIGFRKHTIKKSKRASSRKTRR